MFKQIPLSRLKDPYGRKGTTSGGTLKLCWGEVSAWQIVQHAPLLSELQPPLDAVDAAQNAVNGYLLTRVRFLAVQQFALHGQHGPFQSRHPRQERLVALAGSREFGLNSLQVLENETVRLGHSVGCGGGSLESARILMVALADLPGWLLSGPWLHLPCGGGFF